MRIYVQDNFSHRRPLQLCCGACEQRSYDTVTAVTPPCTDCYSDYASYSCISLGVLYFSGFLYFSGSENHIFLFWSNDIVAAVTPVVLTATAPVPLMAGRFPTLLSTFEPVM